jgi:hypothetical protein
MRGISRLAEDLLASQEGLCSMNLDSQLVSGDTGNLHALFLSKMCGLANRKVGIRFPVKADAILIYCIQTGCWAHSVNGRSEFFAGR